MRDCWADKAEDRQGSGGKDAKGKGKGKPKWSNNTNSRDEPDTEAGPKDASRLDLGCLDQHPDSINSDWTLRYYGKPVYNPLHFRRVIQTKQQTAISQISVMQQRKWCRP